MGDLGFVLPSPGCPLTAWPPSSAWKKWTLRPWCGVPPEAVSAELSRRGVGGTRLSAGCRGHTQACKQQGRLLGGEASGCLWGQCPGGRGLYGTRRPAGVSGVTGLSCLQLPRRIASVCEKVPLPGPWRARPACTGTKGLHFLYERRAGLWPGAGGWVSLGWCANRATPRTSRVRVSGKPELLQIYAPLSGRRQPLPPVWTR